MQIHNGLDFARGFSHTSVVTLVLMADLVLQHSDWTGIPTPLLLTRNVTIHGDTSAPGLRVLDFNWVAGKMRLGDGVVLRLQRVVVANYRLGNHNQAPGLDILVPCLRGASAVVETVDMAGVHRVCYPPKTQEESLAQLRRPESVPGDQLYDTNLPQPGCSEATTAPALERCWAHRGLYGDVAMLSADVYDYTRVQPTGYIVHMIRTVYLCDVLLTDACVTEHTALGCATLTYASLNPPWRPLARPPPGDLAQQPQQQQQGKEEEEGEGEGGALAGDPQVREATVAVADDGDTSALTPEQRAGIGVGVAGGLLLVALAAVLAFMVWMRRRALPWPPSLRQRRPPLGSGSEPPWAPNPLASTGPPAGEEEISTDAAIGMPTSYAAWGSSTCSDSCRGDPGRGRSGATKGVADCKALGRAIEGGDSDGEGDGGAMAVATAAGRQPDACQWHKSSGSSPYTPAASAAAAGAEWGPSPGPGAAPGSAAADPGAAPAAGPAQLSEQGGGGSGDAGDGDRGRGGGGGSSGRCGAGPLTESQAAAAAAAAGYSSRASAAGVYEAAAAAASCFDPAVVVTPLTPPRPDINLQLVLRSTHPERTQPPQPPQPQPPWSPPHPHPHPAATNSNSNTNTNANTADAAATLGNATASTAAGAASPSTHTIAATGATASIAAAMAAGGSGSSSSRVGGGNDACMSSTPAGAVEEVSLVAGAVRGRGSFGRVVEGTFRGQRVAVKLLLGGGGGGGGAGAGPISSESLLRSFTHEVEVLARCQHPNVVRLLAACVSPPQLCLVMELMETSLEQMIQSAPGHLLPMNAVLDIALDVARGLEYLHPTIVHRDLKPANVLVNDPLGHRQVAKLSDFGLARLHCSELRTRNPEAGTPAYMAPECFDVTVATITFHVDMYALGVLLWVMLSGIQPWKGLNFMRLAFRVTCGQERPPLSAIPPSRRPPKLLRLISACWDADPRRRPAAAEAVKELMLAREMVARQGQASFQTGSETAAASPIGNGPLEWPRQELSPSQLLQPPQQLRCMAVFGGLALDGAARAAAVAAAATATAAAAAAATEAHEQQHPQPHTYQQRQRLYEQQMHEQELYEQRLYEQVVLQRLAVGRLPRPLLHRQSSFCELGHRGRWQRQMEAQLMDAAPGGDVWDAALGLSEVPTLPPPAHNRHNHLNHQQHGQGQGQQELATNEQQQEPHGQQEEDQQQQQWLGSGGGGGGGCRFVASLDSSWRTVLSLRVPGELTGTCAGGTALHLTIDGLS